MDRVEQSLKRHIYFIYPDGSLDGSWGIRSNKWTCYGGATSDGSQVLFSLFAEEDPVYANAAVKNLEYLQAVFRMDGRVWPHHWKVMESSTLYLPTFAKAKNLAMAHSYSVAELAPLRKLPSESRGLHIFPTLELQP